ncbi:MAG: MAB_1171c family putative transporter [Pseudonocardia sediminis]
MELTPVMLVITAVLCVGAVLLWIQTYRAPENVPIRFFALSITLLAVGSVLRNAPGGSLIPVLPNNLLNIVNAFVQLSFFVSVQLGRPGIRRIRWELAAAVLASALVVAAYLSAPADLRPVINDTARFGDRTPVYLFSAPALAYLVYAAGSIAYRIRRILPVVTRRVLRISLVVIAVGAVLQVLGGVIALVTSTLRYTVGLGTVPVDVRPITGALVVTGFLALVVGAIVPLVDGVIREVPRIRAQRAALRTLEPLWRELHTEFPELALKMRSPGPGRALYRRVVEIRDGLVLLGPYLDAAVAREAAERERGAGGSADEVAVSVQATLVRDALRARRAGEQPPAEVVRLEQETASGGGTVDWRDDADTLVRLARRFDAAAVPG